MTSGSARAPSPLLGVGQRVGTRHVVERFLGQGAFAEVYRVRHQFLGRQAMKVFKRVGSKEAVEAMLAEAVLLTRLGHPHIVRVFDAGTVATAGGERAFFTMEYVPGGSLERFLCTHRVRGVPVGATVRLLHQVSSGLAVAHAERPPIVHRDVTTENILIGFGRGGSGECGSGGGGAGGDWPHAKLGDFGLATAVHPMTELASAQGVLAFKAPEALIGRRGDSRAGDVWAVGVVAYLMLTGRLPYPKGLVGWLSGEYRRAPPPAPRSLNQDVDEELERIVLGALDVDRGRRPPHAGVLAEQLGRWRTARGRRHGSPP